MTYPMIAPHPALTTPTSQPLLAIAAHTSGSAKWLDLCTRGGVKSSAELLYAS